jgi:multidrug efflux pump subunit AcrA (membrane-fusion protein)
MNRQLSLGFSVLVSIMLTANCGKRAETMSVVPTEIPNVAVSKVTRSSLPDFYEATGTVKAITTTQVSANLMGRIISIPVNEGDHVTRGQMLVQIDNRDAQAQLQKVQAGLKEAEASLIEIDNSVAAANYAVKTAEANRQMAEITFGRYKELYQRKSVSGQEYDEASSKLKSATSEVERAKANVQTIQSKRSQVNARIEQARADIANSKVYAGYASIASPVSGVIVKKLAETGSIASPGVPLLSIEDNSQYRLEASVEESRSKLVRLGNRVNVHVDALGEGDLFGTVADILPSADPSNRTFIVKINLPANPSLKSGLYGLARFPVEQKEAISISETAIQERGQLTGVYVVGTDGIARFRIVTTGKKAEGAVEILSGLSEGDEIVTSDLARMTDGAKVR